MLAGVWLVISTAPGDRWPTLGYAASASACMGTSALYGCEELVAAANELGAAAYDELDESGDLRYTWFKTDGRGNVLVAIVTADPLATMAHRIAEWPERPAGIAWGVHSGRGNDMRGVTIRPGERRRTRDQVRWAQRAGHGRTGLSS